MAIDRYREREAWFRDNRDWDGIAQGLREAGFSEAETAGIMGGNWARFWSVGMEPG